MIQFEKLASLLECPTPDLWQQQLFAIARDCGFSHILFGIVPSKAAAFDTAFLKTNFPTEWRLTYEKDQLHMVDPTVSHCLGSMLPIAWNASSFSGNKQHEFYEQACGYGLCSGISLPIHGSSGEFGMMSFIAADTQHLATASNYQMLATLALIRDYAVASVERFTNADIIAAAKVKLTSRELECLKWIMSGKSSWEISRILCCSEATINFHVANLKKKFNVHTRQQAVVQAIKEKLIVPA